jgi:hypothetical protein
MSAFQPPVHLSSTADIQPPVHSGLEQGAKHLMGCMCVF